MFEKRRKGTKESVYVVSSVTPYAALLLIDIYFDMRKGLRYTRSGSKASFSVAS
jgi:hypothetical protein